MATTNRDNLQKADAARATVQDDLADVGSTNVGASPLTAVPGSASAQDDVRPLDAGAAAPIAAEDESIRDDVAAATTRARFRVPSWFNILWMNKKARVGLVIFTLFVLVAVFAPLLAPYDPHNSNFLPSQQPSSAHLLGTTQAGQDVFSQLIYGTRTSLLVGAVAGALATIIALVIGMTAGYMTGIVDDILSFLINLGLVVPALPLMVAVAAYSPVKGVAIIILVIGFTGWAWGARFKRAQVIQLRTRDYITSAQFAGDGPFRIIFKEIMPNMISLVVLSYIGAAMGAIGAEAGLEFLGLGDPNTVSWGTMLYWANNGGALLTGQWAWLVTPGLALAFLTMSLILINFGVDALSNPQLREE
ncbi:MAG: ABC transporter permease [Chloroflexia bacterium]